MGLLVLHCSPTGAITIQIPFEANVSAPATIAFQGSWEVDVGISPDMVHILTTCDAFLVPQAIYSAGTLGLPCPSVVAHADGSLVTAASPAKGGEELVAYAVGLGQTNPPLATGKLVKAAVPTQTTFGLDLNYRPNALGTKPLPSAPPPIFSGATPGYVGLYQINFVVPPIPTGTSACANTNGPYTGPSNVIESNLTVSVGSVYSFDAARICVAPNP